MTLRIPENSLPPFRNVSDEEMKKLDRGINCSYVNINGHWHHKPMIKRICNPILRIIQFWTDRPYVIVSYTEFIRGYPNFLKYGINKIKLIKE